MLPRVMMLPESVDDFDFDVGSGAPLVPSSPPSSSESSPLPFSNFGLGNKEVSRWALKSDFSGKMSVLALAVRFFSRFYLVDLSYFHYHHFLNLVPLL